MVNAQAACTSAEMIPFASVYSQKFGTGAARSADPNVLNHTFTSAVDVTDGLYAVGRSDTNWRRYLRTDQIGDLDADGNINGRYLGINMRGANAPGGTWTGEFYRNNNVSLVPTNLPAGSTVGGFRFSTALAGTCAGCSSVPLFTLNVENNSDGAVLATTTSAALGVVNDDRWRTVTLNIIPAPSGMLAANLVLINSQPNGSGGRSSAIWLPAAREHQMDRQPRRNLAHQRA